jgi:hypothetical protein
MMLVNVTQRHVAERLIEHVFSVATGVDHIGAIHAISDLVSQLLSKCLHGLKGGGFGTL